MLGTETRARVPAVTVPSVPSVPSDSRSSLFLARLVAAVRLGRPANDDDGGLAVMQTVVADTPHEPLLHTSASVRRHDDGGRAEFLRAFAHHLADGPRVEVSAGHLDDETNVSASKLGREPATDERLGVAPILSLAHALVALELFEVRGAGDRHRRWEGPEAKSTRGGGQRGG